MIRRALLPILMGSLALFFAAGCHQMCARCGETVKVTVLEGVHFDFDKYVIKPEGKADLDKDIELLKRDKTLDISVEGHCDIKGSDEYNQKLSEKRAKAVYDYFANGSIDASRMKMVGWGRTKPLVPNTSESGRAKNRRVEVLIIKARP